ncbi:MAG: Holliday junction branch migration protein RuvA [Bacteroidetes bacterium]|nr:MAG: Holliday junction branch migration protein RuvA [Bacteroidota bacterium]
MIAYLSGIIKEKNPSSVVIDVNGIGYLVQISLNTYSALPDVGESLSIHTHYSVNVDVRSGQSQHQLFGFLDEQEKELFLLLSSVSGVSNNTARMILSTLSVNQVTEAIISGDVGSIKSVKGIGPKLAQKIITELQDKVMKDDALSKNYDSANNTIKNETLSALVALGFNKSAAQKVVDNLLKQHTNWSVEELVKQSIKQLS